MRTIDIRSTSSFHFKKDQIFVIDSSVLALIIYKQNASLISEYDSPRGLSALHRSTYYDNFLYQLCDKHSANIAISSFALKEAIDLMLNFELRRHNIYETLPKWGDFCISSDCRNAVKKDISYYVQYFNFLFDIGAKEILPQFEVNDYVDSFDTHKCRPFGFPLISYCISNDYCLVTDNSDYLHTNLDITIYTANPYSRPSL